MIEEEFGGKTLQGWPRLAVQLLQWASRGLAIPPSAAQCLSSTEEDQVEALRLRDIDSLLYVGCGLDTAAQVLYDKVFGLQQRWLRVLVDRLIEEGISPMIFKGAEILTRFYGSRALGMLSDSDILIDRRELGIAKRVLESMGFRQGRFEVKSGQLREYDILDIAAAESQHYELVPFRMIDLLEVSEEEFILIEEWQSYPVSIVDGRCKVVVEFDVHHRVASDLDCHEFFERSIPSALGRGVTMSLADHLWFTTSRYYSEVANHGLRSLRTFAYLAPMLASAEVDWDVVLGAARVHELRPSLYYYLFFLDRLAGGVMPGEVLDELSPERGSRLRDWGWQLSQLLDQVEPLPFVLPGK